MATGLYRRSACELAALIRAGEVSSREVIEAHLTRIDEVNDRVNAVTVVLRESALAAADEVDRRAVRRVEQPLRGVPFTIKESIDCLDSATTNGAPRLIRAVPYADAPAVARMKAAGAIPLARTNMSEMGMRLCTDNPLRGRTLNPWLPELTVGGSSGGDGAAVATGMSPLGVGSDLGGSLRSPAYCCGIAALKPTTGRVAHASSLPPRDFGLAGQLMLAQGPLARSVGDLRLCLGAMAGRDVRDPRSVDAPLVGPAPVRKRAGLVTSGFGDRIPSSTVAAIERAGQLLAADGWSVEPVEAPELDRVVDIWGRVFTADLRVQLPMWRPLVSPALFAYMQRICGRYASDGVADLSVHAERSRLGRVWSEFLTDYPVVIGPTWARLPWPPDADLEPFSGLDLVEDTARFLLPGSLLGLPALAVPTGVVDDLPAGVQIYADLWREDLCLTAAEIIEAGVAPATPIDPAW